MMGVLGDYLVELLGVLRCRQLTVVGRVLWQTLVTWRGGKVGSNCPEQEKMPRFGFKKTMEIDAHT